MGLKEKDLHGRVHSEARMEKVGDKGVIRQKR